jgi:hypothetical protein
MIKFHIEFSIDPSNFIQQFRWDPVEGLICDITIHRVFINIV